MRSQLMQKKPNNLTEFVSTAYAPPSPPAGTGFHRYQFILFEQPADKIKTPRISSRARFNRHEFISGYKLKLVAQTFFQTENKQ